MNYTENMNQIKQYIKELSEQGAFELWSPTADSPSIELHNIYIPYMMNDAMECYIVLNNASIVGTYNREFIHETTAAFEDGDGKRQLLIVRQSDKNTCTVWFEDAKIVKKLYRFDQICHNWRKGNEQWSQLTYIIGTMYDKYLFNGDSVCNATELSLMKLIEFAPFRFYAPAPELFEELYANTYDGTSTMYRLAKDAHDYSYAFLCLLYKRFPSMPLAKYLSKRLASSKRFCLYQSIYNKAIQGASAYPSRQYLKPSDNEAITALRDSADQKMHSIGFTGSYPEYQRNNTYVRITEEHPFTIMDWDDVIFSQSFMVSECRAHKKGMNLGFFNGKGLSCQVMNRDEFFEKYS